jgi:hypothetical protein
LPRALGICLFLLLFPIGLVLFLWNNFTMGTWLLAGTKKDYLTQCLGSGFIDYGLNTDPDPGF